MSDWKDLLVNEIVSHCRKGYFTALNDFENVIGHTVTDHHEAAQITAAVLERRPDCSAFYFGSTLLFGDKKEVEDFITDYES